MADKLFYLNTSLILMTVVWSMWRKIFIYCKIEVFVVLIYKIKKYLISVEIGDKMQQKKQHY